MRRGTAWGPPKNALVGRAKIGGEGPLLVYYCGGGDSGGGELWWRYEDPARPAWYDVGTAVPFPLSANYAVPWEALDDAGAQVLAAFMLARGWS